MEVEKLLVNGKTTTSLQTNISPKSIISNVTNNRNELLNNCMANEFFLNQSIHKKMQSGVSILSTFVQFLCFTQFGGSSYRFSFDKFAA